MKNNLKLLEAKLLHKEKELYSIQRIGKALSSTLRLEELLMLIMQEITSLMEADRSTLFIVDHDRKEIWSSIALKAEVKEIRLPIGKGISGYVGETGETINITDAYKDQRFDSATDQKTGYRTRSILCMPVWEPLAQGDHRKIIAVIQVLNKNDGTFTSDDETLLEALASQVAISIANARLYHRLEKKLKESDLVYEFEQMLSSTYELSEVLEKLLSQTLDHLKTNWVLAICPRDSQYVCVAKNDDHQTYYETAPSISPDLQKFMRKPSLSGFQKQWKMISELLRIEIDVNIKHLSALFSPIIIDDENEGLLISLNANTGKMQDNEDDRKMLELVAQKISRAQELHDLRDSLIKQERLSSIGRLMSTIVHDIRGPVNTIYGFVDLMGDKTTGDEEREEFAGIIKSEVNSTMNMITEVLDFAKGKTSILPRKTSIKNIYKKFSPRLQQMCQKKNIDLTVDVEVNQLIYADEEKLNRVFYNITKNALEAMGERGKFVFRVTNDENEVTFQFTDNGPGIPREIQDRLFDSFVTSGKESGTGLGLAIVKKIIEEHNGQIEIDSRKGKGATFKIKIPLHK